MAAYGVDQAQARTRMHHVVIVGNHVEQRTLDLSDLDLASADFELAARKLIALGDVASQLAENPSPQRHAAVHPAFEQIDLLAIASALAIAIHPSELSDAVMPRSHPRE